MHEIFVLTWPESPKVSWRFNEANLWTLPKLFEAFLIPLEWIVDVWLLFPFWNIFGENWIDFLLFMCSAPGFDSQGWEFSTMCVIHIFYLQEWDSHLMRLSWQEYWFINCECVLHTPSCCNEHRRNHCLLVYFCYLAHEQKSTENK